MLTHPDSSMQQCSLWPSYYSRPKFARLKATFAKGLPLRRQTLRRLALTRKFLEAYWLCQRDAILTGRKEVVHMQEGILISKETFEAITTHLNSYIQALERKIT